MEQGTRINKDEGRSRGEEQVGKTFRFHSFSLPLIYYNNYCKVHP